MKIEHQFKINFHNYLSLEEYSAAQNVSVITYIVVISDRFGAIFQSSSLLHHLCSILQSKIRNSQLTVQLPKSEFFLLKRLDMCM